MRSMPATIKDTKQLKASGAKLRIARLAAKLTPAELAARTACSVKQIYHCESGDNWFSWPVYIRACRVLNLAVPPLS